MHRRQFITLLGGAAASWPLAVGAQPAAVPVVGYLYPGVPELSTSLVAAFRKGLSETGFVEGRNVAIEYRFANNDTARLPELAADLVRRRVAVIAAVGGTPAALGQSCDHDDSDRLPARCGPGAGRTRRQLQSAGRQCHWRQLHEY
jgi:putative ABC transport system substrate-binding protein